MMSTVLPESTRRDDRPAFEVVLSDGRSWGLALPSRRRFPAVIHETDGFGRPLVRIELGDGFGYRLEVQRSWDAVIEASRSGRAEGQAEAFRRFLVALLRSAHDLDVSHAERLLDLDEADLGRIARNLLPAIFDRSDLSPSLGR